MRFFVLIYFKCIVSVEADAYDYGFHTLPSRKVNSKSSRIISLQIGWPFSSRPDIWMQKRAHGYQVYEPTDGEDDYGEFYHYMKKRNGMSLASFFLPGDLDDMFE